MKRTLSALVIAVALAVGPTQAQEVDLQDLNRLQLSESQVQDLFSLFLSKAPVLLSSDPVDTQELMRELAPRALDVLHPEQVRILNTLAPQEHLEHFGSMSQEQRTRFVFDRAKTLVHPSKQEWLERFEEMVEDTER